MRHYNKGWRHDSARHSLAAKGVKTGSAPRGMLLTGHTKDYDVYLDKQGRTYAYDGSSVKRLAAYGSFSAGTVLQQLGGNRFIAMTGAKNFFKDDDKRMIGFKIGRNAKSVNYVRVTLNPMDTYDMEFLSIRNGKLTVKSEVRGVYDDQLQSVFTENTGMYTHL